MVCFVLQELYSNQYLVLGGISTGFTAGTHVIMSLLLIIRQGWLQAASQACGFILTLNPFESLTPIPQGILGLFVISIGFIAYVLIAASGDWESTAAEVAAGLGLLLSSKPMCDAGLGVNCSATYSAVPAAVPWSSPATAACTCARLGVAAAFVATHAKWPVLMLL